MLNILIDFSKKENVEIKFSETIPARSIKKANIPYRDENYLDTVIEVLEDLKKMYKDREITVSLNFPAIYEGLIETNTEEIKDVMESLSSKSIDYEDKIIILPGSFSTEKYFITPVSLVDIKYRSIIDKIRPDQFTTNMIRLLESGKEGNKLGSLTIVYNSEERDTEVLFFNEDNIPVAYTKSLGQKGITGIADIITSKDSLRTPIDKRKIKSLNSRTDKGFYSVDIRSNGNSKRNNIVIKEELENPVIEREQNVNSTYELNPGESKYNNPTERKYERDILKDKMPDRRGDGEYREENRKKRRPQREEYDEQDDYNDNDDYDDYAEDYSEIIDKRKKTKKPPSKRNVKTGPRKSSDRNTRKEVTEVKKMSPRLIFIAVTGILIVSIAIALTGKMAVDMLRGEKEQVVVDTSKQSVPLTTYISSSMTSSGIRANKVSNIIEDGVEKVVLEIDNISDSELLNLQSRLEIRCVVEIENMESNAETEEGNSRVSVTVYYDLDE